MNEFERSLEKHELLHISRRMVPCILALFLFMVFVSFIVGYFLGTKHATDEFVTHIRHETLAHQLLVSSTVQAAAPSPINNTVLDIIQNSDPIIVTETSIPLELNNHSTGIPSLEQKSLSTIVQQESLLSYNAELIGFGTHHAAQRFIDRVKGYSSLKLELKERFSKTPRGKLITWYQVITEKYEQKQELQTILDILIKKEHLHDVKIVAYSATKKDLA